ncbi:MAG: hypothetical protein MUO34_13140 [Ignavibacteriaceae bacterium]|nr:hypothetical protein [Ignavibacteriaceae bacterium]
MNTILYVPNNFLEKILITLIILSLIFLPGCSANRIERLTGSPEKVGVIPPSKDFPYLKLHLKNGEVYVFNDWELKKDENLISGKGNHLDINRQQIEEGRFTILLKDIVLAETNQIKSSSAVGVLATFTVITGIFTIICIADPKACFGSCPTFYLHDGNDFVVKSEGFSSSISPALEERDIDALYNVKTESENLEIQLRNEAYETHVIRSVNILAVPKLKNGRTFITPEGIYYQVSNLTEASQVVADEGDCSEKLCSFDGIERFSPADSNNLAEKEEIEISFYDFKKGNKGLVIASRQTLLTTFLFYQTLAYMGTSAGYWFANLERNSDTFKELLNNPRKEMGGIEVFINNENSEYVKIDELSEHGPIATDIKIVPLRYQPENTSLTVKLRMTKGLWRIDYVALADLGNEVQAVTIEPESSFPEYSGGSNVIELLTNPDSVLVTFPGDRYFLNYKLPKNYNDCELFLESQGYYLEWIRDEWLAEENPDKVYQMFFNPKQYFKDLAPQFKEIEAEMEETFWSSKYVLP